MSAAPTIAMQPPAPVLAVEYLAKSFAGFRAVQDVSFAVAAGEMVALIGPNGAGKTTTFNLINGQLSADRGRVLLHGRDVTGRPPRDLCRLGAGRTFQITATFASMTVLENVAMALISGGATSAHALSDLFDQAPLPVDAARTLLAEVGMAAAENRICGTLAYGDLKRIELAMAIANRPRLLLMDEPTAGMAPGERRDLMALTRRIVTERQCAVLFTEHDMDVVFAHADRVLVMNRGKLIAEDSPTAIRQNVLVREVYLGNLSDGSQSEPPNKAVTTSTVAPIHPSDGLTAPAAPPPSTSNSHVKPGTTSAAANAAPLLGVESLDAWYGLAQVLHGVSLDVAPGEAVVLLGRNGAGKSTTLKAIIGLEVEARGRIRLGAEDITPWPTHRRVRAGIGFVPEDRRVFAGLTVLENLATGRLPSRDGHSWTLDELFALFPNLGHMQQRLAASMSGGEQQMLTIARTLMGNPRCILLDEPSEGLAPVIVEAIEAAILELKRRGVGLLISEQNLHFARRIADRAIVIERGIVHFTGTIAEIDSNPKLVEQYLGV